jgi:hypothetical protein
MGTTTFTGPIRAGDVLDTTGTAPGSVKNVGFVIMAQTVAITQAGTTSATATAICIPARSHIVQIQVLASAAWSGAATLSIGTTATANEIAAATAIGSIGITGLIPGTDATRVGVWSNTGTSDVIFYVLSSATGTGVGDLVVRYIQAENL